MSNRFQHEDDISAAYEAAEFVIRRLIQQEVILVPDERPVASRNTVRKVAREVADAVIRSDSNADISGDISDVPGVRIERVN